MNKIFLVILLVPVIFACVLVGHAKADDLTVSQCQITPSSSVQNPASPGTAFTFTAVVSGGTGNYTYSWTQGCIGSGSTCQASFSSAGTYTAFIQVADGNDTKTSSCSAFVAPSQQACTTDATQKCVGNAVYWFDSCGNQGSLDQQCTGSQTCSNGACVSQQTGACSNASDCGTNGSSGALYCQGNNIYQNNITWTCNNPGTAKLNMHFHTNCSANKQLFGKPDMQQR